MASDLAWKGKNFLHYKLKSCFENSSSYFKKSKKSIKEYSIARFKGFILRKSFGLCALFLILVGFNSIAFSQVNVLGKPGQIMSPSAQWDTLRQVRVAFAFVPKEYSINNFIKNHFGPEHIYGVSIPLTGFLEVNLNFTRKVDIPDRIGIGDRHIDLRFHLLKESDYLPSLVLVVTPPEGYSNFLSQDLIAVTKNVSIQRSGVLRVSGGYSSPFFYRNKVIRDGEAKGFIRKTSVGNNYLNGFFGSLQWQPWEFLGVMVEFDTQRFNSGMFIKWKDKIYIQGNLFGNRILGISTSVHFPLDFEPFELRSYSKK